ncbi:MAG: ComEC/Rec2 family competence protein [Bdellovibrionota bacterium]
MISFLEHCGTNFFSLMSGFAQDSSRVFWSALVWGRVDPSCRDKAEISRLFFGLGMIHVLVLSGSQVGSFMRIHDLVLGLFLKVFRLSRSSALAYVGVVLSWASLAVYVAATGASAPLVRAFIVLAVSECGVVKGVLSKIALSFVLHVVLFPQHSGTLSFVLSWGAFLLLVMLSEFGIPRFVGLAVLCISCQLLVIIVKGPSATASLGWKGLFANLALVPLFEGIVFPLGSLIASFVIACSSLGVSWDESGSWRQIFDYGLVLHDILAQVFLGALKGIRYI